jgi:hypothetical protein
MSETLYERLDRTKLSGTQIITNPEGFNGMVQELQEKSKRWEKLSLAISGWGAFGVSSYYLAKALVDRWIKADEFVWTSIGGIISTLFAQWYTDEKYIDFIFEWLEKPTPAFLLSKLIPFTIKLSEKEREYLILNNIKLRTYLEGFENLSMISKNIDTLNDSFITETLKDFLKKQWFQIESTEFICMNFLDIQKKHQTRLWIQATVVRPRLFKRKPPRVLKTDEEIKEWKQKQGNKDSKLLPPITFRGSYPVLKALLISSHQSILPNNFSVKGMEFKWIDWYWWWQWYAHKSSDFNLHSHWDQKVSRVLIHTDDNWFLTNKIAPNYGENIDYILRPNLIEWGARDFTNKARERFKERALEIIWE